MLYNANFFLYPSEGPSLHPYEAKPVTIPPPLPPLSPFLQVKPTVLLVIFFSLIYITNYFKLFQLRPCWTKDHLIAKIINDMIYTPLVPVVSYSRTETFELVYPLSETQTYKHN